MILFSSEMAAFNFALNNQMLNVNGECESRDGCNGKYEMVPDNNTNT